jgi:hypothetical protein
MPDLSDLHVGFYPAKLLTARKRRTYTIFTKQNKLQPLGAPSGLQMAEKDPWNLI